MNKPLALDVRLDGGIFSAGCVPFQEVTALEQRSDKTCALKQGIMQELPTGERGWYDDTDGIKLIC